MNESKDLIKTFNELNNFYLKTRKKNQKDPVFEKFKDIDETEEEENENASHDSYRGR